MRRLIVSTLPKDNPVAEAAIRELSAAAANCRVIHNDEMNIHPCVCCNKHRAYAPSKTTVRRYKAYLNMIPRYF